MVVSQHLLPLLSLILVELAIALRVQIQRRKIYATQPINTSKVAEQTGIPTLYDSVSNFQCNHSTCVLVFPLLAYDIGPRCIAQRELHWPIVEQSDVDHRIRKRHAWDRALWSHLICLHVVLHASALRRNRAKLELALRRGVVHSHGNCAVTLEL